MPFGVKPRHAKALEGVVRSQSALQVIQKNMNIYTYNIDLTVYLSIYPSIHLSIYLHLYLHLFSYMNVQHAYVQYIYI